MKTLIVYKRKSDEFVISVYNDQKKKKICNSLGTKRWGGTNKTNIEVYQALFGKRPFSRQSSAYECMQKENALQ